MEFSRDLLGFINESPTAFHATSKCKEILLQNGFKQIKLNERWSLESCGKYFVVKNDSSLVAFQINSDGVDNEGFKIIASHSDAPGIKIKPSPEMVVENKYLKLNTEIYGGPILNTWLDRPLSIAGRVTLKSENVLSPKSIFVNIKRPLCIIPNLAIHMNRNVNSGIELNKQNDMLPLLSTVNKDFEADNYLINQIAKEYNIDVNDILDFELYLYEFEKGSLIGLCEEFISSSRLDNLAMAHASLNAFINADNKSGVNVFVMFDNEEIGSATKQGADSNMLLNILERICIAMGKDREAFFTSIYNSFMISADAAHGVHPNNPQKHDPTNRPVVNEGIVIKINANQNYTSDAHSVAVFENICLQNNIKYQKFVNKSDERGGSTIGPISSTHLDIPSIDVGTALLAMHSIREFGGVFDHMCAYKSFLAFYNA